MIATPNRHWKDARFAYDENDVITYEAISATHKANTSTGNLWLIWKYTIVGSNITRIQGPLKGNWEDRETLAW